MAVDQPKKKLCEQKRLCVNKARRVEFLHRNNIGAHIHDLCLSNRQFQSPTWPIYALYVFT